MERTPMPRRTRGNGIAVVVGIAALPSSATETDRQPDCSHLRLGDLQWVRPVSKRVRVSTATTIMLLIRSQYPYQHERLVLKSDSSTPGSLSVRTLAAMPAPTSPLYYFLAAIPCDAVGGYQLLHTEDELGATRSVVSVACCLPPVERHAILTQKRRFLEKIFVDTTPLPLSNKPTTTTTDDQELSHYEAFVARVTQDPSVADAIAHSPLHSSSSSPPSVWDIDCCEPVTGDFDGDSGFTVWKKYIFPRDSTDDGEEGESALASSPRFLSNGICLAELLKAFTSTGHDNTNLIGDGHGTNFQDIYDTIANTLVSSPPSAMESDSELNDSDPNNAPPHLGSRQHPPPRQSVLAPQCAQDFLVHGSVSHTAALAASALAQVTQDHPGEAIRMWRSDRGDLFYSHASSSTSNGSGGVGILQFFHGPSSSQDLSKSDHLLSTLHSYLWTVMDTQQLSIQKLHAQIAPITNPQSLYKRLQAIGFQTHDDVEQEDWFSLFAMFHTLHQQDINTKTKSKRLTLHGFRVFLIDPFFATFWRRYLCDWRENVIIQKKWKKQQKQQSWDVGSLLAEAFVASPPTAVPLPRCVDWETFVCGVRKLHSLLQWPVSDETICRLLYRFDTKGDSHSIAVDCFLKSLVQETVETVAAHANQQRRPPQVDAFATTDGLRNLYQARADDHQDHQPAATTSTRTQATQLLRIGNSRLARIRNLPVSKLLSEGVHFRSLPHKKYAAASDHCASSGDSDSEH